VSEIVLDASALIAMLKGGEGADKVAAAIADARICAINHAQVVAHFIRLGMSEREVDAMLDPLPMMIVPTDKALAQLAGRLRAVTADHGLRLRFAVRHWQRIGGRPRGARQFNEAHREAERT
jgi:PIN domain nuclease of toxin-antitoxin system